MTEEKMTLRAAYDFVLSKRDIICPNNGFMKQLVTYEVQLYQEPTMKPGDWPVGYQTENKKLLAKETAQEKEAALVALVKGCLPEEKLL
jgi:hypothetical protein